MSGIVASLMMVAAVLINSFGSPTLTGLFSTVLGFTISTTTISYLFIFPSYLRLRYKYPDVPRPYKVPGGLVGAWIVTILPLAFAVIASIFILWPSSVPGGMTRLTYELTQFIVLGIIVLLTIVFYVWGQLEKKNEDVVVELNLAENSEFVLGD
jgi:amino acid transporter